MIKKFKVEDVRGYLGNLADYEDFKRYINNQDEVRITKQFRKEFRKRR